MSPLSTQSQDSRTDDQLHPPTKGHLSSGSIDTTVSGIADSTISFAGSLHLGRFPAPPVSIPNSPIVSEYSSSITGSGFTHSTAPLTPRRNISNTLVAGSSASAKHKPKSSVKSGRSVESGKGYSHDVEESRPSSPQSRIISPFDWHEGASSIDVDATEDRLLSTNFITSLLQENSSSRSHHRASINSDAYSGFSEMTYPPIMRYPGASERTPPPPVPSIPALTSPRTQPLPRPHGARPPPSAFSPIPEGSGHISDDSDTLASNNDFPTTVIRSASISRGLHVPGATVVGVAPARLHSYSSEQRTSSTPSDDRTLSYGQFAQISTTSFRHNSALASSTMQPHFLRENPRLNSGANSRQSVHSTKSFVPSVISRISEAGRSMARVWKKKPLPPVPTIPHIPIAAEEQSRLEDSRVPLPHLVARAEALNGLLEKGYHPHHSIDSAYYGYGALPKDGYGTLPKEDINSHTSASEGPEGESSIQRRRADRADRLWSSTQPNPDKRQKTPIPNRKRYLIILAIFIVIAGAAIGAGVGASLRHKSSPSLPVCSNANTTGTFCDLDATCVCTSTGSGQCNGLAQSLISLTPTMNKLFDTNYSDSAVYTALSLVNGSPTDSSCASQAILVDTPGLSSASYPNRTSWARAALLWNFVESQNETATTDLQSFTRSAPWSDLSSDGPVTSSSTSYSTTISGFTFNFAAQTVIPPAINFTSNGQPAAAQISRVSNTALLALDRMYSYAVASSTQRSNALQLYWVNTLGQSLSTLPTFRSAVLSSILIPFDATYNVSSQALANQMTNSTTQAFPVPLSCYPGLNSTQIQQINSIEQTVYGLSGVSPASSFNTSCYPDRPLYGVLDVLRLRLPFIDSRTGVATQAATLQTDVFPRVVVRSGELLSALPSSSNASAFTASATDPREYGTSNNMDHVLLNFLMSIPDVNVASALASFLTSPSNNGLPPSNASEPLLANSIGTIPSLEVAVFGSVLPSDIGSTVSSFVSSSGALFFGSNPGNNFRDWTTVAADSSVAWAQSSFSTQVAQYPSPNNTEFESVWLAAALAIATNAPNVGVSNITSSLQSFGLFQ